MKVYNVFGCTTLQNYQDHQPVSDKKDLHFPGNENFLKVMHSIRCEFRW